MPWSADYQCRKCDATLLDVFRMTRPILLRHRDANSASGCPGVCDEVFLPRQARNAAAFGTSEMTLAFRRADGVYSIPLRNDAPTPPGCQRIEMRSLREVAAFEKASGLRSERAHFDRGTARGFDDGDGQPTPPCLTPAARAARERRFLSAWQASR